MDAATILDQAQRQHAALPAGLGLPSFGQIGIVVDDLQAAAAGFGADFGIATWYRPRFAASRIELNGQLLDLTFDILLGYAHAVQFELLRVDGTDRELFDPPTRADQSPLHHVGYFVSDGSTYARALETSSLTPGHAGVLKLARNIKTRFSYWRINDRGGGIVELIDHRVVGLRTGMPEWLIKFGAVTGRLERRCLADEVVG